MATKREITPETLPAIVWCETKVITTELLAVLYGTDAENIQKNYERNAGRFEEGKHFFKLAGEDLREFKQLTDSKSVSRHARNLTLWTERGAARHAKMLETDQAWDVFEKLEDCYFHRTEAAAGDQGDERSTVRDRAPLLHDAIDIMVSLHIPLPKSYRAINQYAGVKRMPDMTRRQTVEAAGFSGRILKGEATQRDFERIARNAAALHGEEAQLQLVGVTVSLPGKSKKGAK
ncbi:ORF6N domain-containing protein [Burkholderia gladioli]|uniref:ORF6N domain-containing protein n=1 Tax=Burkholderia gladioli TaxID=28095 RepID=UPI00236413BA|nr:ORF6N domain-containing protein [Burkholderia gladioli]MDD1789109.1 ORF6N domain-containing protein [Burkholderia gladioli]